MKQPFSLDTGGIANVGVRLHAERPMRIGTMIAGNSGRPGGACGQANGSVTNLHAGHGTQEEDVVSNWLITAVHKRYDIRYRLDYTGQTTWGESSEEVETALSNEGARWCVVSAVEIRGLGGAYS
jgi:hypothetical protein